MMASTDTIAQSDKMHTRVTVVPGDAVEAVNQEHRPANYYRAVLERDEDGRIVVTCAELEGVVTDGATEDEALHNAVEAISAYLESMGISQAFNLMVIDC